VEPVEPVVPSVRLVEPVALVLRVAVLRLVDSGGGLVTHNYEGCRWAKLGCGWPTVGPIPTMGQVGL